MDRRYIVLAVFFAAFIAWGGMVLAQTAKPAALKTIKLSNGQEIFDFSGEWDASVENLNALSRFGTYPQVWKIMQDGISFTGIRLKDNPPPSPGKAGSTCMEGEVDQNGIKKLIIITSAGAKLPSVWKVSDNGYKVNIDSFDSELPTKSQLVRLTLIRK